MPRRKDSTYCLGARSVRATNRHPASCSDDVKSMPTTPAPEHWLHLANLSSSLVNEERVLRSENGGGNPNERRKGRLPLKS